MRVSPAAALCWRPCQVSLKRSDKGSRKPLGLAMSASGAQTRNETSLFYLIADWIYFLPRFVAVLDIFWKCTSVWIPGSSEDYYQSAKRTAALPDRRSLSVWIGSSVFWGHFLLLNPSYTTERIARDAEFRFTQINVKEKLEELSKSLFFSPEGLRAATVTVGGGLPPFVFLSAFGRWRRTSRVLFPVDFSHDFQLLGREGQRTEWPKCARRGGTHPTTSPCEGGGSQAASEASESVLFPASRRGASGAFRSSACGAALSYVIQGMPNIESLNLSGCYNLTDNGLGHAFVQEIPSLRVLNLSLCKQITDSSLGRIAQYLKTWRC